jgi:hypothetical protein
VYVDRNHLLAESRLLVLAGTNTSAATICGLLFYLAHYPRVLAKVTAEVRSAFASTEEIMMRPNLSRCQYLRACVDETLHIAPSAPGELPRDNQWTLLPRGYCRRLFGLVHGSRRSCLHRCQHMLTGALDPFSALRHAEQRRRCARPEERLSSFFDWVGRLRRTDPLCGRRHQNSAWKH